MTGVHLPQRVVRELSAFVRRHGVSRVILFGSRARGTHTQRSDVDIAVEGGDFDGFFSDVKNDIHSLLTFDIVAYDEKMTDELKQEIKMDGVTLYEEA